MPARILSCQRSQQHSTPAAVMCGEQNCDGMSWAAAVRYRCDLKCIQRLRSVGRATSRSMLPELLQSRPLRSVGRATSTVQGFPLHTSAGPDARLGTDAQAAHFNAPPALAVSPAVRLSRPPCDRFPMTSLQQNRL